jgi:phage terminase large subunit-like protein
MKSYYQYSEDVLSGKIVAGNYIKLACKRFECDLKRDDLDFKEEIVDDAIEFISTLKHFTGKHSNQPFIPED